MPHINIKKTLWIIFAISATIFFSFPWWRPLVTTPWLKEALIGVDVFFLATSLFCLGLIDLGQS